MKRLIVVAAVSAICWTMSAASPWTGKKVAFLGDSITDPAQTNRPQRIYWQYLTEDMGLEPHVYAVSGYQWDRVYKAAQKMKDEMGGDVDAIVIFAGTNDYMNGIPLGEWYDVAEVYPMNAAQAKCFRRGGPVSEKNPDPDNLHPNTEGHRRLAKTIAARLMTLPKDFKEP